MNCPNCLSIMYNRSEIHNLPNNSQRMDLHCWNSKCPPRKIPYGPHMSVIIFPNQKWICNNYHFPFLFKNEWFTLEGENNRTKIQPLTKLYLSNPPNSYNNFAPIFIYTPPSIINLDFIPISTDNDMHLEATKLFNRLINLIPFS